MCFRGFRLLCNTLVVLALWKLQVHAQYSCYNVTYPESSGGCSKSHSGFADPTPTNLPHEVETDAFNTQFNLTEIGILNSKMEVQADVPCGTARVTCWDEGEHDHDFDYEAKSFKCKWEFTMGAATKFYCSAYWYDEEGHLAASISRKPVFGGDAPAESSTYKVDFQGMNRIKANSDDANDKYTPWGNRRFDDKYEK